MAEAANRTLQRGLAIMELLGEHPQGLELHEIAAALSLPKSSAHNLVQTLLALHYVRLADGARYQLTLKTFEVGATVAPLHDEGFCRVQRDDALRRALRAEGALHR